MDNVKKNFSDEDDNGGTNVPPDALALTNVRRPIGRLALQAPIQPNGACYKNDFIGYWKCGMEG